MRFYISEKYRALYVVLVDASFVSGEVQSPQGSCCIDCCEHVQCTSNLCVNQKKVRERSRYELHVLHQVAAITTCTHSGERRKQITMLILFFKIECKTLITDAVGFTI